MTAAARRAARTALIVALAALTAAGGYWGYQRWHEARSFAMLNAQEPARRQRGAWRAGDHNHRRALQEIARRLDLDTEPDATVREAYVHALGRPRDPAYFATLATVIRSDPAGPVRTTAWVSAARADRARFIALARPPREYADSWDCFGVAQANLLIDRMDGVDELLELAVSGDGTQRELTADVLRKRICPLLELVGRVPPEAELPAEQWTPQTIAALTSECNAVDLAKLQAWAVARNGAPAVVELRRTLGRIHGARRRLGQWLGTDD